MINARDIVPVDGTTRAPCCPRCGLPLHRLQSDLLGQIGDKWLHGYGTSVCELAGMSMTIVAWSDYAVRVTTERGTATSGRG